MRSTRLNAFAVIAGKTAGKERLHFERVRGVYHAANTSLDSMNLEV